METRRHTKELQAQRDLADRAEASRFTELRNFLETQENAHMASNAERHAAMLARVEQLEAAIRLRCDQTDNTLAAHIGQLEDRLDRRRLARHAADAAMPPAGLKRSALAGRESRPPASCASASLTCVLAGIGTGPQTPAPPFMILVARQVAARPCRPCTSPRRP